MIKHSEAHTLTTVIISFRGSIWQGERLKFLTKNLRFNMTSSYLTFRILLLYRMLPDFWNSTDFFEGSQTLAICPYGKRSM